MSKLVKFKLLLLSIIAFIFSAVLLSKGAASTPKEIFSLYDRHIFSLTDFPSAKVQEDGVYIAQDLVIIDSFAFMKKTSTQYYLAVYFDANHDAVAVRFVTKKSDPIYSQLNRYLKDDSQQIGDCVLNCYVKVSANTMSNSSDTGELRQYFDEAVEEYEQALGMSFQRLDLRFSYLCGLSEDPIQALSRHSQSLLLGAALFMVVSLVFLIVALIRPKSKNAPPQEIPAANPSSPATVNSSQLANLETLHNAGILTDEEYSNKLRQLKSP